MKAIILALLLISANAKAEEYNAAVTETITYTYTDEPCDERLLSNPDKVPLKHAFAYDSTLKTYMYGCALDYGNYVEFQLIDEARKKHIQAFIPKHKF